MSMYRCNLLLKVDIPAKYQRDMTNNITKKSREEYFPILPICDLDL